MLSDIILRVCFITDLQKNLVMNFFLKQENAVFANSFPKKTVFPVRKKKKSGRVNQNERHLGSFETNGTILFCSLH